MPSNPRILFWKLDDSDFVNETYLTKIEDIARRSRFDMLLIALTWCKPTIYEQEAHDAIAKAAERAQTLGMKLALDIDIRPARDEYLQRHPKHTLGITDEIVATLDENGKASGEVVAKSTSDHYGRYDVMRTSVLKGYAFDLDGTVYDDASIQDVTKHCKLKETSEGHFNVDIDCSANLAGKTVVAFVLHEYTYPDIFASDVIKFHDELMQKYSDVPLGGVTIDEWGAFPYPDFDFSGAWRRPWYSTSLAKRYHKETERDFLVDALNMRFAPKSDPEAQDRAINAYYDLLRVRNVEIEANFYRRVKKIWGADTFVGVHPTWYAIDETADTPEIWKNGLDWWDVKRDFGQTDEIAIYPVRLALAHKTGGQVFYNMWYSMGSQDVRTYWEETWENLRYGGRTHYLGYECRAETPGVMELASPGKLESVSKMEELIILANLFQKSAAKSNVAVIMNYRAAINWKANIKEGLDWDMQQGILPEAFGVANKLFKDGFMCDVIPSYEIEDGDLKIKEGQLVYGSERYDAAIFVGAQFITPETKNFLDTLRMLAFPLMIAGQDNLEPAAWLDLNGVRRNDVPGGCRLQDKSVMVCTQGKVNRGNRMKIRELEVNGHWVEADCEDAFGIALVSHGEIHRMFAGKLSWMTIDGIPAFTADEPEDVYIERRRGGPYKVAHLYDGKIFWRLAPSLV